MKEGRLSDVDGCEALTNTLDQFKCDVEGYARFVHIYLILYGCVSPFRY